VPEVIGPTERTLRYLEPLGSLAPADAVVALIIDESGKYLVQLRDSKPTIYFPDHWGCFGGAVESGETEWQCLARELEEEIALDIGALPVRYFTAFSFDFSFAGGSTIRRTFYEVRVATASLSNLKLREGRAMELFPGPQLLTMQVVPYDRFALWMHCYRAELAMPEDINAKRD
jgi:8-oxo-dGTP pyrophosphatase MutT (NUDIX family)